MRPSLASTTAILKRLDALERAVNPPQRPMLINVWTKSLAERVEKVLPPGRNIQLVNVRWPDEAAEAKWEADFRENNPEEMAILDILLQGKLPPEWQER